MAVTVATFQSAIDDVVTSIDASDWKTAMRRYAKAEAIHAGLELQVGSQAQNLARRNNLLALKDAILAAKENTNRDDGLSRFCVTQTSHTR